MIQFEIKIAIFIKKKSVGISCGPFSRLNGDEDSFVTNNLIQNVLNDRKCQIGKIGQNY